MAVAETVQRFLEQHSVEYDLVPHPHTGSSHETAEAAHVSEDHIAKAVIVKDTAGFAMVVVPASNWVEVEHLRKELNRDFHLATEDELAKLFSDYLESGDHEQLVRTAGDDFRTLLGGVRHGYYSHDS
jgi:Ala-tRNA(Pro) deacylase